MSLNIGHRGAAGLEPENTLRSFHCAAAEGADVLELDLRVTRDGHLVVLHDPTVERTTNGTGRLRELTLAEVRRLDAGLGERVPTFVEMLDATTLPIHAELKEVEAAELLAGEIFEGGAGRVTTISFLPEALRLMKRALPYQQVGLVLFGAPPDAAERALSLGADLVSLEANHLDAEVVERCRQADLEVTTWTVNDTGQMRRVMELEVDGIVTDRPDLLAGTADSRLMWAS